MKVYIVFRGCDNEGQDIESVHADIISAREAVEEILRVCAAEGFIYNVPEKDAPGGIRLWRWRDHFISIEPHEVQSSTGK